MPPLVIPATKRTGHPLLDLHHAEVLGWANLALGHVAGSRAQLMLEQAVAGLIDTLSEQHAWEELVMSITHHPDLRSHELEHRRVIEALRALHRRAVLVENPELMAVELRSFIQSWLRYHAHGSDLGLAGDLLPSDEPEVWIH